MPSELHSIRSAEDRKIPCAADALGHLDREGYVSQLRCNKCAPLTARALLAEVILSLPELK